MDTKCCSKCAHTRLLSCFLKNASANLDSKVFSTCIPCRDQSNKRRALQPLDPNRPSKRRVKPSTTTRPAERTILPLLKPGPLASVPPPLFDHHPGPIVLPLRESRSVFETRTTTRPTEPPRPPLLEPRPLAEPPPLLNRHPDPVVLSESRSLFKARTKPSIIPVLSRVLPRVPPQPVLPVCPPPIQPIQPQPLPPVLHHVRPQPPGFLPAEQRGDRRSSHAITTAPLESDSEPVPRPPLPQSRPLLRPEPFILPLLSETRSLPPTQPRATGFLPAEQWGYIQSFKPQWIRSRWRPAAAVRNGGLRWI